MKDNMKKYVGNMKEYVEYSKKYKENMKAQSYLALGLRNIPSFPPI